MKRLSILFTLFSTSVIAQDCLKNLGNGICVVTENEKYGVKKKDKFIVPTYFDQLIDHSNKYFSVQQHEKWGLFDIKGHMLLPVAYDKINVIDGEAGLIQAEGNQYNNLIITEKLLYPMAGYKVSPFLVAGSRETSISEYFAFMYDMRENTPNDFSYELSIPDTIKMSDNDKKVFRVFLATNDPCVEKYEPFRNRPTTGLSLPCTIMKDKVLADYLNLPITGISYKQAQRYCLWLTEKMNAYYTPEEKYEFIIRLPKPQEWEQLAEGGLMESMKKNECVDSLNEKKCILLNYKYEKQQCLHTEEQVKKYGNNVVPVDSYNPDMNGLLNVFGNVAEMTTEQGVCKGGGYVHYARQCNASNQIHYFKPEPWLGFRWVAEYRMKQK
jgi:formylglycine-generating enzyme required for sulfatase activity